MTKEQIIESLEKIVNENNKNNNGFTLEAVTNEWNNYGKNRTYFEIRETRAGSKHMKVKKYGYYDNQAGCFVGDEKMFQFTFSGARFAE